MTRKFLSLRIFLALWLIDSHRALSKYHLARELSLQARLADLCGRRQRVA